MPVQGGEKLTDFDEMRRVHLLMSMNVVNKFNETAPLQHPCIDRTMKSDHQFLKTSAYPDGSTKEMPRGQQCCLDSVSGDYEYLQQMLQLVVISGLRCGLSQCSAQSNSSDQAI